MQGHAGPVPEPSSAPRRSRAVAVAMVVVASVVVLATGAALFSGLAPLVRRVVSTATLIMVGIVLTLACGARIRLHQGRRRQAWMLFTIASLFGVFSNVWVALGDAIAEVRLPLAEVCLITALVVAVAGLIAYPSARPRGTDLVRMVLDGAVLGGSALLIAANTVYPELLHQSRDSVLAGFTPLAVPIVDLALATFAWLSFTRGRSTDRPALGLAAAGFLCFAVSHGLAAAAQAETAPAFGAPSDLGWIIGYLLLVLGVFWSSPPHCDQAEPQARHSAVAGTVAMFAILVVAASVHLAAAVAGNTTTTSNVLLILVLMAVAVRQTLLTLDNEGLHRGLERRVIERSTELREVTQRTDLLVDSVGDGVYGVDEAGRITFVNPAARAALGYRRSAILGHLAHDLFHDHPPAGGFGAPKSGTERPPTGPRCYLTSVIADGLAVSGIDDVYRAADGALIPVEVTVSPLAPDVSARGAVVVFRDVTERREVDRLKNEFVSMVSHELRTPLTAIRGSLGLLAGGALGELSLPATRMVEIAMDSSRRLTRLIDQILDLERIESGTVPLEIGSFSSAELIEAAVDQIRVLAEQAQVSVVVAAPSGVVLTDADRVVQTLLNLLGNAVKFSPAGSTVTVTSRVRGDLVEFRIDDEGRGIPEHLLETIFIRFEQVDSSDAREKGGTGLGLAISRNLVERLGGRIWAQNRATGGASFRFELPRSISHDEDPPPMPWTSVVKAGRSG